jgi:chloramphenicol-sensitive protein RarD
VTSPDAAHRSRERSGILFAIGAYGIWGVLPAYFLLLQPAGAIEIVAWRILFSLIFCAVIITATSKWPQFIAIVRQPRLVLMMGLAAALIFVNWQVYVYGTLSGHVIETSLGYFINPIVTVLLGVLLLRERLRPLQWIAVGISGVAVLVLAINYGSLPWISLTLAFSFGLYGLIKKRVGGAIDAVSGLTIETAWLVPVATVQLVVVGAGAGITFGTVSTWHTLALISAGVVTAVPLLLFAGAARRLPLVYMGLIQYLAPVLQFLFGAFVLHEAMPTVRWLGFALVWVALMVLSIDLFVAGSRTRRASPVAA